MGAGDASGTIFTYQSKGFSMDNYRMPGASLSKWPSAVMISGKCSAARRPHVCGTGC